MLISHICSIIFAQLLSLSRISYKMFVKLRFALIIDVLHHCLMSINHRGSNSIKSTLDKKNKMCDMHFLFMYFNHLLTPLLINSSSNAPHTKIFFICFRFQKKKNSCPTLKFN